MTQSEIDFAANDEEIYIDLRQILKILKKRAVFIIGLTLLVGIAAGLISHYLLTPIYQADTLLRFSQATDKLQTNPNPTLNNGGDLDQYVKPVLTMNTHLTQLQSRELMQRIINKLQLTGYTPAKISNMITASVVKDSNLIQIKVQSTDPAQAAQIANTLSDQYLQLMNEKTQEQINSSVTFLSSQKLLTQQQLWVDQEALKQIPARPTDAQLVEKDNLERDIQRLNQTLETLNKQIADTLIARSVDLGDSSMVIMSAAAVPTSPIKPNLIQNVLIALVLGLMFFTLLAFVREYLDQTVKTTDDFRDLQLSVLGIIPVTGKHYSSRHSYGG